MSCFFLSIKWYHEQITDDIIKHVIITTTAVIIYYIYINMQTHLEAFSSVLAG